MCRLEKTIKQRCYPCKISDIQAFTNIFSVLLCRLSNRVTLVKFAIFRSFSLVSKLAAYHVAQCQLFVKEGIDTEIWHNQCRGWKTYFKWGRKQKMVDQIEKKISYFASTFFTLFIMSVMQLNALQSFVQKKH